MSNRTGDVRGARGSDLECLQPARSPAVGPLANGATKDPGVSPSNAVILSLLHIQLEKLEEPASVVLSKYSMSTTRPSAYDGLLGKSILVGAL